MTLTAAQNLIANKMRDALKTEADILTAKGSNGAALRDAANDLGNESLLLLADIVKKTVEARR